MNSVFTVPEDVPHERVLFNQDKYQVKAGDVYEKQGFTVLWMSDAEIDSRQSVVGGCDPDRRPYRIRSYCRRRPVEITMDIPEEAIPEAQRLGMKLL